MRNKLLAGAAVFLVLLIIRAPADIVGWLIAGSDRAALLNVSGTLWHGQGDLLVQKRSIGRIFWDIQGVTILQGKLGYDVRVTGSDVALEGSAQIGIGGQALRADGTLSSTLVNGWLAPYNIELSGRFDIEDASVTMRDGRPVDAAGEIHWTGGPVTYRLSGDISTGMLPEMTALLGPGVAATVLPQGGQTPLLQAKLQENGFARIGVTKLLTKMLNQPWPGADPDHAVVLEVEEQVF